MSGTANAVLADAKFPRGSFACIITEYPIFIGLGIRQGMYWPFIPPLVDDDDLIIVAS